MPPLEVTSIPADHDRNADWRIYWASQATEGMAVKLNFSTVRTDAGAWMSLSQARNLKNELVARFEQIDRPKPVPARAIACARVDFTAADEVAL